MLGLTLSKYGYIAFAIWVILSIIAGIVAAFIKQNGYSNYDGFGNKSKNGNAFQFGFIVFTVCFIIGYAYAGYHSWLNTNTAKGQRFMKDMESEFNKGLEREIVIYSEEGREIYRYEGKVDLKVNQDSRDLEFIDQDGRKQIIIFGIQDTAVIKEK